MENDAFIQVGGGCVCNGGIEPCTQKGTTGLRLFGIHLRSRRFAGGGYPTDSAGRRMAAYVGRYLSRRRDRVSDESTGHCSGSAVGGRHLPRGRYDGCGNGDGAVRKSPGIASGASVAATAARFLCGIFAVILLAALLPPFAFANELPAPVEDMLGQSESDLQAASEWQLTDLFAWLGEAAGQSWHMPVRFALQACGYLLLAGAFGLVAGGGSWRHCLDSVSLLGFGILSLSAMMSLMDTVVTTAQDCQNYLIAFVPVYSGVAAVGGQSAGALVYSGMFFAMSGFLAAMIENILLPVMQVYFCFAACACIWGNAGIEEAASLFAKCLHWLLKVCGIIFSLVLGLQNILAGSVDNAVMKTGKSALQGFIPVVGDAAAAALSGAAAAVQMLKGSLALAALGALAILFLPVFLHCLLYTAAFAGAGIVASSIGQKQSGRLCKLYFEGTRLCASVLVLYFFMVFLSTALLLVSGNGG